MKTYSWLLLLCILFAAVQSIQLGHRWVDDESWYLMPIPSIITEGRFRIPTIPGDDQFWPQPPLLTYLESFFERISPLDAVKARLIPLTAGIFLIVVVFFLTRLLFASDVIAILAAIYLATDNLIFLAARTVRPEILTTLGITLILLCLVRAQKKANAHGMIVLAGIVAAVSIYTHPNGLIAPITGFLYIIMTGRDKRSAFQDVLIFSVVVIAAVLPLIGWIIYHDAPYQFANFQSHWLKRYGQHSAAGSSLFSKILPLINSEFQQRYVDFIQFPYRVHIAVVMIGVLIASFIFGTRDLRALGAVSVFQLLFFIFVNNSNPSVRYLTTLMPLVAIFSAYWTIRLWKNGEISQLNMKLGVLLAAIIFFTICVSQSIGNGLFLYKFRHANYKVVCDELNTIIPPRSTVYGSMAFWLGLHKNYLLVPYMRINWSDATRNYQPNIIIMDDWVMTGGGSRGTWGKLRQELKDFVALRGKLIGEVQNDFYGDLKIYSVLYEGN